MADDEQPLSVVDVAQLVGFLFGAVAFIILVGLDLRNALKKGAHWVPGRALVLTALTVQIMNFVENQSGLLDEILDSSQSGNNEIVMNNLFMIHTTRVMLCVLVAFFLPGMARPGSEEKWTKIAAIGLTVFVDIFWELSTVRKDHSVQKNSGGCGFVSHFFYSWSKANKSSEVSFFISGAIISITLLWLILLLICAAIASKSIRNITSQKIPIILAEPTESTWQGVEDQVLKSWIVSRACYPESIIARSVLASSAAQVVTFCILTSVVGWLVQSTKINFHNDAEFWLKFIITIMEIIFILIGWGIIGWRWFTSIAYYGRGRKQEGCSHYFRLEDYWTRHIVDLRDAEELKLRELKVDERISKMFVTKLRKLKVDERVNKMIAKEKKRGTSLVWVSLQCAFWLQCSVVFFSKLCCFFSDLILGNVYIRKIASMILSKHSRKVKTEYEEYEPILTNMEAAWDQTASTLFLTNRKSIKQAKAIMRKGNKDGENCHGLIPFLKDRSSGTCTDCVLYLDPEKARALPGFKFLWKHYPVTPLAVEKYFKYASKRSWKLTAVSLINIIVKLSPVEFGRESLQAYYEAWELIDLVDESDPETDNLLSKAADRLFTALREQNDRQNAATATKGAAAATAAAAAAAAAPVNDLAKAEAAIKDLANDSKKEADAIHARIVACEDTMEDWEKLAARNALYKLCMTIDCTSGNHMDLIKELESSLAVIIDCCINKVPQALVDNSRKWAQQLDRTKLLEAVYIAGKSKGLVEKLPERGSNVQVATTTEVPQSGWSLNVHNAPTTEGSAMV